MKVQDYCDSDYASDFDRRRSISSYAFTVGGNIVSWKSSLQHVFALSTTKVEYIAITEAVQEAVWLNGLPKDFGFKKEAACVWCDSQSVLCLSKNNVFHERTKQVDVQYYFICDIIAVKKVEVQKIHTSRHPPDILTKVVSVGKFNTALDLLKVLKD